MKYGINTEYTADGVTLTYDHSLTSADDTIEIDFVEQPDMAQTFGPNRSVSLCRELTKLHEEVVRTTLGQAIEKYTQTPPKGEFVLVLAGAPETSPQEATPADANAMVERLMDQGLSRKDAVRQTAAALNLPKNVVYDAALHSDS